MNTANKTLSDITVYMKYAKYIPELQRRETWKEIVTRNKEMHIKKFPHLETEINKAYELVYDKKVLPSMRGLQFAGKPIEINPTRIFNCSYTPISNPYVFAEIMFLLLSGCGVGFSVQNHHIEKLPEIRKPFRKRRYLIGDSIEGWADAVKKLMYSYFFGKSLPIFDFSDIRAKGERLITSGGKAPGPEPLKECLFKIQLILDRKKDGEKLTSLECHDIVCHIADCVLAGGIRRAALISLFDFDNEEMITSKCGNWWELNPQRGRANNSAVIVRNKIKEEEFLKFWEKIKNSGSGEPGLYFTNDKDWGTNPCCEIALKPNQFCNLTTINVSNIVSQEDLNERVKAAVFIGTLQASYTNFHYLREIWKKTTEKEALIGISMTGIASGAIFKYNLEEATEIGMKQNESFANAIGINIAARVFTIKPEGTASCVLGTSSGIHAWHNDYYIRRIRVGKNEAIYKYLVENHPDLVEDEYFRPTQQAVISIPQKSPEGSIIRINETALSLLERVKYFSKEWIKKGHRSGANTHNISATVSIKDNEWEEVGNWMWENKEYYNGLSVLPYDGGTYKQAPFEDITKDVYNEMIKSLSDIDLTKVIELNDDTDLKNELACVGGACEIQ
jgi:ribonucleoside-triphosphate reductase (thioredoxin)